MNRRNFFQFGLFGIFLSLAFFWKKLTIQNSNLLHRNSQKIPFNKNKLVSFFGEFIIVNKENRTQVFNAHCTHLGCTLNKVEDGVLVCPCHGSKFNLDGEPIKGPAYKPLEKLNAKISSDNQFIEITI